MARPKPWLPRLPLIIEALEAQAEDWHWYTRRDIELLFQVGRTAAGELMHVAGITRPAAPGLEAAVSSENLLHYLRNSPDAQDAMQELRRRRKLAERLAGANEDTKLRAVKLAVTPADEYTLLRDLPNVSIDPG